MSKIKKTIIAIVSIVIVVIIIATTLSIFFKPKNLEINQVNLTNIADGNYEGSADNGIVLVVVDVTVENQQIVAIKITKHQNGLGKTAEKIVDRIIEKQSLDVDVISGATYSSQTILKAVENALNKGE